MGYEPAHLGGLPPAMQFPQMAFQDSFRPSIKGVSEAVEPFQNCNQTLASAADGGVYWIAKELLQSSLETS
jgi:hypothetical protein